MPLTSVLPQPLGGLLPCPRLPYHHLVQAAWGPKTPRHFLSIGNRPQRFQRPPCVCHSKTRRKGRYERLAVDLPPRRRRYTLLGPHRMGFRSRFPGQKSFSHRRSDAVDFGSCWRGPWRLIAWSIDYRQSVETFEGPALVDVWSVLSCSHFIFFAVDFYQGLMFNCVTMPGAAMAFFIPTILSGMGFSETMSLVLTTPPYIAAVSQI